MTRSLKTSVFIATSLDGFIARADGSLDWLPQDESEDYGYSDFMKSVDTIIMGRKTYEQIRTFTVWPYPDHSVLVLSHHILDLPATLQASVQVLSATPAEIVRSLTAQGAKHLYVDGGQTIQAFLRAGLIQELIMTRIPVLIGHGIPLFGSIPQDIRLHHLQTRSFASGLVQSHYKVVDCLAR